MTNTHTQPGMGYSRISETVALGTVTVPEPPLDFRILNRIPIQHQPIYTMVQPSKKDLRKSVKGKTKAVPEVQAPVSDVEVDMEDESEWSDEDEDEDNGGVSEKGMKRLMELVGEEDLDEDEMRILAAQDGEEEDDEEEDEDEEDEEDEEMEDEDESEDEEVCLDYRRTGTPSSHTDGQLCVD